MSMRTNRFAIVLASAVLGRPRWWAWGAENARIHAAEIEPGDLHDGDPEPAEDGSMPTHALVEAKYVVASLTDIGAI